MTLTIELTEEEEARLHSAAAVAGLNPEGYLRSLIGQPAAIEPRKPLTGREIVDQLMQEGVIGSGFGDPNLDSPEAARKLRAEVWRTRRASTAE